MQRSIDFSIELYCRAEKNAKGMANLNYPFEGLKHFVVELKDLFDFMVEKFNIEAEKLKKFNNLDLLCLFGELK